MGNYLVKIRTVVNPATTINGIMIVLSAPSADEATDYSIFMSTTTPDLEWFHDGVYDPVTHLRYSGTATEILDGDFDVLESYVGSSTTFNRHALNVCGNYLERLVP